MLIGRIYIVITFRGEIYWWVNPENTEKSND